MIRQQSTAIVLRRWAYSESSLVIRALTPDHGVLALFAKGFQRPKSGHQGVLDIWCHVEIAYGGADGAELFNLYETRLINRFPGLAASPERLAAAALVAEIAETAAPPGPEAGPVFLYLLHSLEQLQGEVELPHFLCTAVMEGLELLGLGPLLDAPDGQPAWFSPALGGVQSTSGPPPHGSHRRLAPRQLQLLRTLRDDPDGARAARSDELHEALTILEEFLLYHLERQPKALDFLHRRHSLSPRTP